MIPQVPPPEPASDFGIERTAFHMSAAREAFPGTGMNPDSLFYKQREAVTEEELPEYLRLHQEYENALSGTADDTFADAVQGALSQPIEEGTFRSEAEQAVWEAEETRARQRFHKERAKAASEPIPTGTEKDRAIFEKSIAARRAEKAKQQEIARAALAKVKALTLSIRSMEDAVDGLLISEA